MLRIIPKFLKMMDERQDKAILEFSGATFFHEPLILTEEFRNITEIFGLQTQSFNFTNTTFAVPTVNSWVILGFNMNFDKLLSNHADNFSKVK